MQVIEVMILLVRFIFLILITFTTIRQCFVSEVKVMVSVCLEKYCYWLLGCSFSFMRRFIDGGCKYWFLCVVSVVKLYILFIKCNNRC